MIPQVLSPNHERGYYIVWNTDYWRKDRVVSLRKIFYHPFVFGFEEHSLLTSLEQREFTLHYADLESPPPLLAQ
jgi:hypothetical protein